MKQSSGLSLQFSEPAYARQAIENQLEGFLIAQQTKANDIGFSYAELVSAVQILMKRGGKRLRPLCTIWSYGALGGTNEAAIVATAASQELFHGGVLMLDDVIDEDTERWNGPNITGHYLKSFESQMPLPRARHLADSYALMAGNVCIDLSYQQLLVSGFADTVRLAAVEFVHNTFFQMLGGECLDVASSLQPIEQLTVDELVSISHFKTAVYSFCMPLELGTLLAGVTDERRDTIHELGVRLGIAFQLQDDYLGLFGDPEQMGKSVLSDLREGKRTLLIHYGYQQTTPAGRRTLKRWLGNPKADTAALQVVQTILKDAGSVEETQQLIQKYSEQAQTYFQEVHWQSPFGDCLEQAFQSLIGRQR